jgi:hypothetical protein
MQLSGEEVRDESEAVRWRGYGRAELVDFFDEELSRLARTRHASLAPAGVCAMFLHKCWGSGTQQSQSVARPWADCACTQLLRPRWTKFPSCR